MAYTGYDDPPISVVCTLTEYHTHGFLHQLFARSIRMLRDVSITFQILFKIVPDDPWMAVVAKRRRSPAHTTAAGLLGALQRFGAIRALGVAEKNFPQGLQNFP
jgi:hypothetical protein